jgi:hypothetical protein
MTRAAGEMTRAIVVATGPGALAVVGGLPLAVRAVLTLWELGVPEVGVAAGAQDAAVTAALGRRGLSGAADSPPLPHRRRPPSLWGETFCSRAPSSRHCWPRWSPTARK